MPTDTAKRQARATEEQAEATKSQAKQTARTARNSVRKAAKPVADQAGQTVRAAEKTVERAGRTLTTVLVDTAYASIGVTDTAVAFLRSLPTTALKLRTTDSGGVTSLIEREFDGLAVRGRKVVDAIATNPATQRAVEQTKTARHQLKTAAGQVRKTAEDAAEAVQEGVEAAGTAAREVGTHTDTSGEVVIEIDTERHSTQVTATKQ